MTTERRRATSHALPYTTLRSFFLHICSSGSIKLWPSLQMFVEPVTSNADKYFWFHMHFYVNFEEVFRQCFRSLKCHFGALHLVKIALLSHKYYILGRDLVRVGRPSGAVVGLSWSKDPPLLCRPFGLSWLAARLIPG